MRVSFKASKVKQRSGSQSPWAQRLWKQVSPVKSRVHGIGHCTLLRMQQVCFSLMPYCFSNRISKGLYFVFNLFSAFLRVVWKPCFIYTGCKHIDFICYSDFSERFVINCINLAGLFIVLRSACNNVLKSMIFSLKAWVKLRLFNVNSFEGLMKPNNHEVLWAAQKSLKVFVLRLSRNLTWMHFVIE